MVIPNLNVFTRNFALINYNVIILFETWLRIGSSDNELRLFPTFSIFRCDREIVNVL